MIIGNYFILVIYCVRYGSSFRACTLLFSINQSELSEGKRINESDALLGKFHGSRMEGFLSTFPPINVYGNPVCGPPALGWGKREGRFMTPQGLNYLELCKAILSQVNPSLPPPLKKASTKECGVQVNAKVDKTVQCSLGPKTLFGLEGDHPEPSKSPRSPDVPRQDEKPLSNTPPVSNLRFLRPVSIYSPVFDRRAFLKKLSDTAEFKADDEAAEREETDKDAEADYRDAAPKGSNFQVRCQTLKRTR